MHDPGGVAATGRKWKVRHVAAIEVTDETFELEVLRAKGPVLVDFSADWCGPCKAMAPALNQAAVELQGKVKVVKVDTAQARAAAKSYDIRSLPTLILFKDGKPAARHLGAMLRKDILIKWINDWATGDAPVEAGNGVATFKLANGMDLVVITEARAPFVTQAIWYRAGAADAPQGSSGLASLVERLTHKSVQKSSIRAFEQDVPKRPIVEAPFGAHDVTVYFRRIAADDLKVALETEVERMTHLRITDEDVATELKLIEDGQSRAHGAPPHIRFEQKLSADINVALNSSHPYGAPVAGFGEERSRLSREDALRFHERYYAPNNAVLVVAGDLVSEDVRQLVEETFGKVPAKTGVEHRSRPPVPSLAAARRIVVNDKNVSYLAFRRTYSVPSFVTARPGEAEALDVLGRALGIRIASLIQEKFGSQSSTALAGYYGYGLDAGVFFLRADTRSADLATLEATVDAATDDVCKNGFSELELEEAKKALVSGQEGNNQDRLVRRYGGELALGRTIEQVKSWPEAIAKVTAEDVKRVANEYLDPARSVTGCLVPETEAAVA